MKKFNAKGFSLRKLDLSSFNVKFLDKFRIWFAIPICLVLVGIIAFLTYSVVGGSFSNGMNLGIDFTGGTVLEVRFGSDLESDSFFDNRSEEIKGYIEDMGFAVSYVQKTGSGEDMAISVKYQNAKVDLETANQTLKETLAEAYGLEIDEDLYLESISASSATDLLRDALIALAVTFVVMLLYVAIRFEFWSGISALIALIHDVFMMIAFTMLFHIEVNSTYVAAVITIVSYSINNTIVVFDRLREHLRMAPKNGKLALETYTELAINETFGRSSVSTVTTMIPVLLLAIFGVESLREFAWPIMFGLISGQFSSLILAPTLYVKIRRSVMNKKDKSYLSTKTAVKAAEQATERVRNRQRNNQGAK